MSDDNFNEDTSRKRRDSGMQQVEDNNPVFSIEFAKCIDRLPRGWRGTCEDIRRDWQGIRPRHPNAWGACWNSAKRRGSLIELQQQVHMVAKKSHARKTHLHEKA